MPQLDHLSYLSQIFWLIVIFGSFYFITLTYILPTINQIIKTRKEKLSSYTTDSSSLKIEESLITYKYQDYLVKAFINSGNALDKALETSSSWSNSEIKKLNSIDILGALNAKVINKIAILSLKLKNFKLEENITNATLTNTKVESKLKSKKTRKKKINKKA